MNDLALIKAKINTLPVEDQKEMLDLIVELEEAKEREESRVSFLTFVKKFFSPRASAFSPAHSMSSHHLLHSHLYSASHRPAAIAL